MCKALAGKDIVDCSPIFKYLFCNKTNFTVLIKMQHTKLLFYSGEPFPCFLPLYETTQMVHGHPESLENKLCYLTGCAVLYSIPDLLTKFYYS